MRSARHHNHKFPPDGFRFPSCSDRLTFIRRHHQVNTLMCSMSFMLWCSEQFFSRFLFQGNISKILRQKHFLKFFSTCETEWKNNFFLCFFCFFIVWNSQIKFVRGGKNSLLCESIYLNSFFFICQKTAELSGNILRNLFKKKKNFKNSSGEKCFGKRKKSSLKKKKDFPVKMPKIFREKEKKSRVKLGEIFWCNFHLWNDQKKKIQDNSSAQIKLSERKLCK